MFFEFFSQSLKKCKSNLGYLSIAKRCEAAEGIIEKNELLSHASRQIQETLYQTRELRGTQFSVLCDPGKEPWLRRLNRKSDSAFISFRKVHLSSNFLVNSPLVFFLSEFWKFLFQMQQSNNILGKNSLPYKTLPFSFPTIMSNCTAHKIGEKKKKTFNYFSTIILK